MGLTRKGFERWLRAKGKDEVVGRRSKEHCCPLARYLQEQGHSQAEVSAFTYYLERPGPFVYPLALRQWAQGFVKCVDGHLLDPGWSSEDVTAAEARAILRRV